MAILRMTPSCQALVVSSNASSQPCTKYAHILQCFFLSSSLAALIVLVSLVDPAILPDAASSWGVPAYRDADALFSDTAHRGHTRGTVRHLHPNCTAFTSTSVGCPQ
jgi:hypothetical protein